MLRESGGCPTRRWTPGGADTAARDWRAELSTTVAEPLLAVGDLSVSYAGARHALHHVSLSVDERSIVAILGNNGAGKSTLLRAISGVLALQGGMIRSGQITFGGRSIRGLDPGEIVRTGVVQVPEGRRIFQSLTVEENLRAGALPVRDRAARARARKRVHELFPILAERRGQRAGLMSGGEQQMLAIGRALMSEPRLLLLDEPSLGLAPRLMEQIAELITEINRQGTSIVLVEQNAAMALDIADRAYVLEAGTLVLEGTASELARSEEVRESYLGGAAAGAHARMASGARPGSAGLSVNEVSIEFGGVAALAGVSFEVAPGSTHALIGPNGAGKSSCLNVLTGVYRASAGAVRYREHELMGLGPHAIARLGVSRTFQNPSLAGDATVLDTLMLGRHRLSRAGFLAGGLRLPSARREQLAQQERVREIAALMDLVDDLDRRVATLTYGERKRVELARALCAEPGLLLLDEPVAGMNATETHAMATSIARLREKLSLSIILVEHDVAFVMGLAERVTVLDFGRRIADGTPEEVRKNPDVLRAYLGSAGHRSSGGDSLRAIATADAEDGS